ncbi:hypothetical protein [Ornithinibacillus gellani]|uniref:hypothetical protein n=1 Tax=Ornithinibacillus gellani TaxID=2293253 RepID=UPI0016800767|nr:hypothetical protein [Ornithinibacillus gellani]
MDVVAGSSLKKMELEVEGIGQVTENWTTLGVAQKLSGTWDVMNLLTTILLGFFGLLWLFLRLIYEKQLLTSENETLRIIGWPRKKIIIRNGVEQNLIITTAFGISLVILYFMRVDMILFYGAGLFWIISIILSTILLGIKEKELIRVHAYKRFASIIYYRHLVMPLMFITCLSILLISMQLSVFGEAMSLAGETKMGEFIGEETLWFQLAISAVIVLLSTIALSEGINTLLMERKQEFDIYYRIGWKKSKILFHIWKESAIWFLTSAIIAFIICGGILYQIGIPLHWIGLGSITAVLILGLILNIIILTRRYFSI